MDNSFKEIFHKIKSSDKRIKIFIIIGFIGIALILLSELIPSSEGKKIDKQDYSYDEYVVALEEKTENIIGLIDGVGECRVMITLKDTRESVFAKNSEENQDDSSYSNSYEYVLYKGQDGETPVLIKEYFPQVNGVAIVCSGADNVVVKENIINSISSLFNIPTSKISVSKIKQ